MHLGIFTVGAIKLLQNYEITRKMEVGPSSRNKRQDGGDDHDGSRHQLTTDDCHIVSVQRAPKRQMVCSILCILYI